MFSIRRSLAWMSLSQGLLFVVQFGGSLVLARLLSPREMGVFALAVAIVGLLSILRQVGLSSYLVRASDVTPALLSSLFSANALLALLIAAAMLALSLLGGALLDEPGVERLLAVMAILPVIGIFDFIPAAMIERKGNFRAAAVLNMLRVVIGQTVTLAMAFAGFSYMSLAYGQISGALVGLAGVNLIGRAHVTLRPGLEGWREIIRYGLHMLAISGVSVVASRLAELAMARLLGLAALGLYSRAAGLYGMIWDNAHTIIARIVFVHLAEQRRQGLSLRGSYIYAVQMVTAVLWPAFAGLAITAGPVVTTLYGPAWAGAATPLSLLCLAAMVLVAITMTWEVFVVCEQTALQARFEFVRAGVGLLLFVAGCVVNIAAAAGARVGEAVFAVALYRGHLERMTDTNLADFLPIYGRSLLLTVVAVAPAAVVMSAHDFMPGTPLAPVLAAMLAGVALWAGALGLLGHPLAREAVGLLARLRAA